MSQGRSLRLRIGRLIRNIKSSLKYFRALLDPSAYSNVLRTGCVMMKPISRIVSTYRLRIIIVLVMLALFLWFKSEMRDKPFIDPPTYHVAKFTNQVLKYSSVLKLCYRGTGPSSLADLKLYLGRLKRSENLNCRKLYELFISIYQIRVKIARISFSSNFQLKLSKTLGVAKERVDSIKNQTIVVVDNLYSLESVVFNIARMNLPDLALGNLTEYIRQSVDSTRNGCDFCSVAANTATDTFGRMESEHTVIVSNAFKIEKYHGLAIPKRHHATMFNQYEFVDAIHLIMQWFKTVHSISPVDTYRIIYWDLLLKAGVSQMHPHFHLTYGNYQYYAKWNELYQGGLRYSREHDNKNYWWALLQIHTALGLSVRFGDASLMAYLTPKRDYEVFVISEKPSLDFFRLVFFAIRSFIDDLKEPSISMGWVFPKLYRDKRYGDELPMIFRIVSRGDPISLVSDISSYDLYGTANVNRDPYKAIKIIRASVSRRATEKFEFPDWEV